MSKKISNRRLSQQSPVSTQLPRHEVTVSQNTSQEVAQPQEQHEHAACELQIVHVTNGRIRIRFTGDNCDAKLESISQKLKQYQGIQEVVFHQQTNNVIVKFDTNLLPLSQILRLLQDLDIQISPEGKIDPFAAWKSLDFWQEQAVSLIPLMTGLAVTGGLGISGLASIPVYMITANATRLVIDYLETELSSSDTEQLNTNEDTSSSETSSDRFTSTTELVYSIAHAIPGRIRFHIPQLAKDRAYSNRLEKLLKADPQVTNVRVNQHAASIAIAYQPSEIPTTHWVNLIESALEINPPIETVEPPSKLSQPKSSTKTVKRPRKPREPKSSIETVQPPSEPKSSIETVQPPSEPKSSIETVQPPSEPAEVIQKDVASLWSDMKPSALSYSLDYIANLPLNEF